MTGHSIRQSGQIIREYDKDDMHYYLTKSGNIHRKWGVASGGSIASMYEVDQNTRICKSMMAVIECASLKNDPDLAPLISW
jgi:hypothetical protein